MQNQIKEEWEEYYKFLEALRRTGATNMWGATPYLVEAFQISHALAKDILTSWIDNYEALSEKYSWQK